MDQILQPDSPTLLRFVEAGLDGEDVPGAQDPLAAGGLLEGGEFVEVEADAVAEVVDVAPRRPRRGHWGGNPRPGEEAADDLLEVPAARSRHVSAGDLLRGGAHQGVPP